MFFKKSTRAIVAGKRPKSLNSDLEQDPVAPDSDGPEQPKNNEFTSEETIMNKIKLPRWAFWTAGGTALALLVIIIILAVSSGSKAPEGPVLPEIKAGQTVISVQADTALTALTSPGDIVQLYAADGAAVEELQYLQVYKPTADGCLLLLVDSEQAAAIVARDISSKVVLISHDNAERAGDLLALQERINDPEITLKLQSTATMAPGENVELDVYTGIEPAEATLPQVQWQSSDPSIAEVQDGTVLAAGVGQATITATCGDARASCTVAVEVPLVEILLDQKETVLAVGDSLKLTAAPNPQETTHFDVTWSSSDPAIATISEDGTVTGAAPGTVEVTASSGDITAKCTITVGYHAEIVKLDRETISLAIGQTYKLTPSIYPSEDIIDVTEYESSNSKVATVAQDGTVTAVAAGTVTITFRCGEISVKCKVTVTPSNP